MDINILLALQDFRNGIGGIFAEFLDKMTFFGEMKTVLIIMALIYWGISKEIGTFLLMGWSGNRIVNGLLKVTACAYRPWIRDARIVPYGDSMETATSYSFPSGHSMNGTSLFGGAAMRKELPRLLRIVLAVIVVLIAFSRIFLGVHTPQDILAGTLLGLLVMWLTGKLIDWLKAHPEKDVPVMIAGIVISVAVMVFAALKQYPADYDAAGNLIVDGAKMAKDTFKGAGWCIGFLVGWVMERRWVRFSTDVSMVERTTRIVTGLLGYYIITLIMVPLLKSMLPDMGYSIISCFIQMFYVSFVFPWCIVHMENKGG